MKKPATRQEKQHMGEVAALGCLICGSPAQVHHVHGHAFGSKSNWRVAPLCSQHHHMGPFGHCVHMGAKTFEQNYMTEARMLEIVNERLGVEGIEPVQKMLPRR